MDTDSIISSFLKEVDNTVELQKNINVFARQISKQLLDRINNPEAVLGSFENKNFAFTIFVSSRSKRYTVRIMDLEEYQKYYKLGTPEYCKSIRADFEHEPDYAFAEELHKVVVILLFRKFNIEISPEEE